MNQEDLGALKTFKVGDRDVTVPEIEAQLYATLNEGAKVQVALVYDEIAGFMLYHKVYNCLLVIRHMYVDPKFEDFGVAWRLADSVEPKKVIFQTRKENPPARLLELTEHFRTLLNEDEKFLTWEMPWRSENA